MMRHNRCNRPLYLTFAYVYSMRLEERKERTAKLITVVG